MESHVSRIPNAVVLEEILPRLPVKSLLRFGCVSKCWNGWISDPKFSLKPKTHRIAIALEGVDFEMVMYDVDYKSSSVEQQNLSFLESEIYSESLTLLCSYNGLLLLSCGLSVYLFNPSTRKCSKVLTFPDNYSHQYVFTAGICYDFSTSDYKIVIGIVLADSMTPPFCYRRMEWYSTLRKKWGRKFCFPCIAELKKFGPVINDKLYCWATKGKELFPREYDDDESGEEFSGDEHERRLIEIGHTRMISGPDMIFVFDSEKDVFVEVPTPGPELGSKKDIKCLFDLDGHLAMARWDRFGDEAGMELLVMKQDSWTLLFTFANFNGWRPCQLEPLYITDDGEVLIDIYREKVVAYSIQEDAYRDLFTYKDLFITQVGYVDAILLYRESLICPPLLERRTRRQRRKIRQKMERRMRRQR